MTVRDAMREIRKIVDAIDTLNKYNTGEMSGIANQHVDEIRELLERYMDAVEKMKIVS